MNKVNGSFAVLVLFFSVVASAWAVPPMGGSGSGGNRGYMDRELDHNRVLPQIAVGKHYTTQIFLQNMGSLRRMPWVGSESLVTSGKLSVFHQDGTPFPVQVNGAAASSEYSFSLEAGRGLNLVLASDGPDLPGWALIEVDEGTVGEADWGNMDDQPVQRGGRLYVSAFYALRGNSGELQSQVGVMPTMFDQGQFRNSIVFAHRSENSSTGVALVNVSSASIPVTLRLEDLEGNTVAEITLNLAAGNQTAQFIHELFEGQVPAEFEGTLEVTTEGDGVIVLGILMSEGVMTSIPAHHFGSWDNDSMGGGMMGGGGQETGQPASR